MGTKLDEPNEPQHTPTTSKCKGNIAVHYKKRINNNKKLEFTMISPSISVPPSFSKNGSSLEVRQRFSWGLCSFFVDASHTLNPQPIWKMFRH